MKDSEIPAFTEKLLKACADAVSKGDWKPPVLEGGFNFHCCPMAVLERKEKTGLTYQETDGFVRGYDIAPNNNGDYRFYALGQAFRKIALEKGFA